MIHIGWICSSLLPLIPTKLIEIPRVVGPLNPMDVLLKYLGEFASENKVELIIHLIKAARILMALFWKKADIPVNKKMGRKMLGHEKMFERGIYFTKGEGE